ncbi:MAG: LuxR C-terminal-related transcriptional regulator [Gaiellaceae bacterium]
MRAPRGVWVAMESFSQRPAGRRSAVLHDRHPLWLEGAEQLLARNGVDILAVTTSRDTALALVQEHQPDIFLTELESWREDGPSLASARELAPGAKTIVVSSSRSDADIEAAFALGASAYVLKSAHPDDLASAVRQAFQPSVYTARGRAAPAPGGAERLTRRELEILTLLADGHSNAQLARLLWVTEQTIKFHLSNLYRKLGVSNRTEASRWAHGNGLLAAPVGEIAA